MRTTLASRSLVPLVLALALLAGGCGDSDSSGERPQRTDARAVDRGFVADMIPHHQAAVQMAKIAQRRGSSTFVNELADDIVRTQTAEIATMRRADERLKRAGAQQGALGVSQDAMGMNHDATTLDSAEPFDPAFLRMMLPHHAGAITMSRAELAKGKDRELRRLARQIIAAQQREISAMRKQLARHDAAPMDDMDAAHGSGHSG